jgi:glycosyltransferase involved in cell wall biosynthesis
MTDIDNYPTVRAPSDSSRPHVAVVDHMLALGGGEMAIARLAGELEPYLKMTFIIPGQGPFEELLRAAGLDICMVSLGSAQGRTREQISPMRDIWSYGPALAGAVVKIAHLVREIDADLVYTNSLKAHIYGNLAARLANRPCVMHVRDILAPPYLSMRLRRALGVYMRALPPAALITNSAATAAAVPLQRHAHVIPSGIAIAPARRPLLPGGPILALMGRLTPWKGQDVAIRALPRLVSHFPGIVLRLAGDVSVGSKEYENELRSMARHLGVADRVEFCGFLSDPYAFFADANLVLHTSINPEPFGQVIIEALAVGRPVVASAGGGPSEILSDAQGGILTPPGDVDALAIAIKRILTDEGLHSELADAAVLRAGEYTLEASGRLTREILDRVGGERRSRRWIWNARTVEH